MARAAGSKDYISLATGLITETSPLNAPEGSTSDELNFLLDLNGGIRKRRRGYENTLTDFTKSVTDSESARIVKTVYWKEAEVIAVFLEFSVSGGTYETWVRFHESDSSKALISEYKLYDDATTSLFVSEVRGSLVITGNGVLSGVDPLLIVKEGNTAEIYQISLFVRDFELVDDGLQISGRPATLSDEHKYNLFNAGWYAQRKLESTGKLGDPLEEFSSESGTRNISITFVADDTLEGIDDLSLASLEAGDSITVSDSVSNDGTYTVESTEIYSSSPQLVRIVVTGTGIVNESAVTVTLEVPQQYPSNADIPQLGLKTDADGNEEFSADTLNETVLGNTEAPRGHYVYDIENFDRNVRLASPGTDGTVDSTLTLLTTVSL